MDETGKRLMKCFEVVFPDLPEAQIASASQTSVAEWDSVAAITMMNVIEDEFGIEMDFDAVADLDSFDRLRSYLVAQARAA